MPDKSFEVSTPESLINVAKEYMLAGQMLLPSFKEFELPVYFLFIHSIELILKSYLNVNASYKRRTHSLKTLYSECLKKGFPDKVEFRNLIGLIESENEFHGYRYFHFKSTVRPEINYLAETAKQFFDIASIEVKGNLPTKFDKSVVGKIIWGKPQ